MEIKTPSYLLGILSNTDTNENDTLTIKVSDLREFREQCEYNARFAVHPYYIPIDEACEFLGIAKGTLYDWLKKGKVHGRKFGRKWMVRELDLL